MGAHPDEAKDEVFQGLGRVLVENGVTHIVSSETLSVMVVVRVCFAFQPYQEAFRS